MGNELRGEAVRVLTAYLELAFKNAGLKWDSDSNAEVAGIVDNIIAAAREPVLTEHAKAVLEMLDKRLSHIEDHVDRGLSTPKDSTEEHGLL